MELQPDTRRTPASSLVQISSFFSQKIYAQKQKNAKTTKNTLNSQNIGIKNIFQTG